MVRISHKQSRSVRSLSFSAVLWIVSLTLALPPYYLAESIVWVQVAYGQTYAAGYKKYQKGDFKGAEKALSDALKTKLPRDQLIKTLKLLGICQFNLNNTGGAGATFRKALQLNPNLTISDSEALVPEVIPFFNKLKPAKPAAAKNTTAKPTKPKPAPAKTPAPAPAAAAAAAAAGSVNAAGKSKEIKRTTLLVKSTTPGAKVWIDGLIKGDANQVLDMDPGQTVVEVQQNGYITKKIAVNIVKNRENTITADLDKPKPKPKPVPKESSDTVASLGDSGEDEAEPLAALAPVAVAKGSSAKNRPKVKARGRKGKKPGVNDMFAPDPGDDQFYDNARSARPQQQAAQGPNAAQQFQMESSGAAYPPQAYPPAAGGYQQPAYQQPMPYGYAPPPPMYYAPPPPAYYPPPAMTAPPPPPIDNYSSGDPYAPGGGGVPGDPAGANGGVPPGDPSDPSGDPLTAREKPSKCKGNILVALLPFGAGQIQNCKWLLGAGFALLEGGALYMWYSSKQAADAAVAGVNTYQEQYAADGLVTAHSADDDANEKKYVADVDTYVQGKRKTSTMAFYGFIGLWIFGAGEAIFNAPSVAPTKKRKTKKRRSPFSQLAPQVESPHVASTYEPHWTFGPTLAPLPFSEVPQAAPQPAFELRLNF